jgi:hypothetical protein
MSVFRFENSSVINVSIDGVLDPESIPSLPDTTTDKIDIAVIGFGNFISGTFQQNTSDPDEIVSNTTITANGVQACDFALLEGANRTSHFATMSTAPTMSAEDYSNALDISKDNLIVKNIAKIIPTDGTLASEMVTVLDNNANFFANLKTWAGTDSNVKLTESGETALKEGTGGWQAVLVQAVSGALFQQYGKATAILNDDETAFSGNTTFGEAVVTALKDTSATKSDTKIFDHYLASGMYDADTDATEGPTNYDLDGATFDFIVNLTGSIKDTNDQLFNTTDARKSLLALSLGGASDATSVNKVSIANSTYSIRLLVRLVQKDGL